MNKKIPEFSYSILYNIYFLIFTLVFSLLFIAVYSPFNLTIWFTSNRLENFAIASIVIFAGFGFLFFSRILLYLIGKKIKLTYWQYLIWIMLEFLMFAIFYSIFTKFILIDPRLLHQIILKTSFYTFLILLIPYSLSFFYFYYLEKSKQLARLKKDSKKKKASYLIVPIKEQSDLIHFYDEKGILRLSVKHFNLFYIESDVNYITVYYTQNDELLNYTLRSSLVKIEESTEFDNLIRCHRSFLINFDKVKSFKKDKEGGTIELDHHSNPTIPVSKTYLPTLLEKFQSLTS
jgi:hypothetical protein